jgi:hypothetical protein
LIVFQNNAYLIALRALRNHPARSLNKDFAPVGLIASTPIVVPSAFADADT